LAYRYSVFILLAFCGIALSANAQTQAKQDITTVPDIIVTAMSGLEPQDRFSIVYNGVVDVAVAKADLKTLLDITGWQAQGVNILTDKANNSTFAEFTVSGAVNWKEGILQVEPFAIAFKRFNRIQIGYIIQGTFPFQSLRNYSDKYVNIQWQPGAGNTAQNYAIIIKDHNFDRLNLPLKVSPTSQTAKSADGKRNQDSKASVLIVLLVAVLAGAVVFAIVSRVTQKRKE
jgi:hypothetical protein